jgi:SAM-dependent methyltransferase
LKKDQFRLHHRVEDEHWWFVGRREIVRAVVEWAVPLSPKPTIVDIGCGTGGNIGAFAEACSCIGLDVSPEAIRLAQSRRGKVEFICGDALSDLGNIVDQVDLFLLLDVLEHIEDDAHFLKELVRSMKTGAQLLITVPADMALWSPHDENYGHYRRYTGSRLSKLWSDRPLRLRFFSHFNTLLYPIIRSIRLFSSYRNHEWGEAGTDFLPTSKPVNRLLTSVLNCEARIIKSLLAHNRRFGFPFGVSLMALLRKE